MSIFNNAFLAESILNIAFQSLVILIIVWGIVWILRSKSAPMRSTVIILTMVLLLALPMMNVSVFSILNVRFGPTLSLKYVIPPASEIGPSPSSFSENQQPSLKQGVLVSSENSALLEKITASGLSWIQIINFFGILWGIGTLLFLVRLLYGAISLKTLKKGLIPMDNADINKVLLESKCVFPRSVKTNIYESAHVRSPLVLGFFKPFILLPSVLLKKMHKNDLRNVLTHELSHIYHRDQMVGILQRLITTLNWWNPLVYTLSASLSRAREEISDNHVLLRNNSKDYAECLVNLAEDKSFLGRITIANAMASSHIPLKERVKFILSKERNMETRLKKSTVCMLVLVSCLIFGLIVSYRMTFAMKIDENQPVSAVVQEKQAEKEQIVRATEEIQPPKLIKKVEPIYPEKAKKEGIEGIVILELTTDKEGIVQKIVTLRSIPMLDKAAVDAAKQWVFEPLIFKGEPRSVVFTVQCRFQLKDQEKGIVVQIGVESGVEGGEEGGVKSRIAARRVRRVRGGVEGGVEGRVIGEIQGEIEKGVLILDEEDEKPKLIKKVEPVYPESAKKNGISGEVIVQVTNDIYGRVVMVKILKSIPELDDAAVEAVRQWIYEPYLVDGKPVKVAFKVSIHFRLR